MRYRDVLDLTPYQIAALLTEKSTMPGSIDPDDYMQLMREREA